MKNILILPNPTKDAGLLTTEKVAKLLSSFGAKVYLQKKYANDFGVCTLYTDFPKECDLIVVIGGDGSVLDATLLAIEHDVPILGVNLGKMGYLSEVEPWDLEKLSRLFTGEYRFEEKMLLSAEHEREGKTVAVSQRFALNDVVISHASFLGIANFVLSSRQGGKVHYRADGIILATPAGSTAYSLSAGGPVVSHDVDAILVTPVCPHAFFDRSVIFSGSEVLSVENSGQENLNVSVDGRCFSTLIPGDICRISVAPRKVRMLTFKESNMLSTLFRKMKVMDDMG